MPSRRQFEEWKRRVAHKQAKERQRRADELWAIIRNDPPKNMKYNKDIYDYYARELAKQMQKEIDQKVMEQFSINNIDISE